MKYSILVISILIFGCSIQKNTNVEMSHRLYFINYSKINAEIYLLSKSKIEDSYKEIYYFNLRFKGVEVKSKYDAISANVGSDENYFKAKYYVEGNLIGIREYTKEQLLIKKQGELAINKRGKIKK